MTLEILPKIEGASDDQAVRRSLVHMLAKVLDLDIATGPVTALGWQSDNMLEIIIRMFCGKLFAALRQGIPRQYTELEEDVTALRGTLDVVRQFTIMVSTPQKLACRFDELNQNVPLNQIMKAAISRLRAISSNIENQRRLAELMFAYDSVATVPIGSLRWDRVLIDRTNAAWAELLRFAKLFLQHQFQSTTSGSVEGFSLLFEMNTLFEEFVGRILRSALRGTDLAVQLQGPRKHALIDLHTGAARFATRPDIVVSRNGKPLLVIDTKWKRLKGAIDDAKRGVGQADVYQMMAYSHVYECDRLMLLYPHHHELAEHEGLISLHQITNKADNLIGIVTVGLVDPQKVGVVLKGLLLGENGAFDLRSGRSALTSSRH
ncbi:McrC family protein [Bradyrhizobium quebecense]|uniref:McrC family protein n=1 Tax=Bradyrhizobium quebecense TaxID=2748629 RepID=UPI001AEEFD6F|nr:restriction endonuclease [Bradyrhizobium quebecense]UGA44072.1 McrC family protein [Bradyrhizobium quebecense]